METAELRYNWADSDVYETFIGRWSEHLASPFLSHANVARGDRVLDVACGTGVLSKALAEAGAHVIGVDASEGYLEGARRRRSHPNIAYEHGDVRKLRFDANSFDAAVSTLALDVIPEIEQVVSEMKRVTRPGGVVASAVTQFLGGMPAFDLVINTGAVLETDFARLRSMRAGRQLFWPDGQATLWRKIGLVGVTEIPIVVDCEYASFADYWATFTDGPGSTTSTLMALSDDARGSIEQHVRAGYLVGLPDGPRSFPMMFRMVRGLVPA
ncbi:SAM-dependent methyltransferase [Rhizobium sp. L9]|uniref:class I SAM-dependent methyltransferase n=1 Tax=Rhizobium TaxID=379 RepID=UPI000BE794D2|nr:MULTISPECIES: class I SAM-dependent methyltransferase [Rhizobium]MBX5133895.1 class I SAM-dependent methyltransferase [Rhizobium lentis]MBX5139884.1 class I SAM-dependent methyltransferase [Rhizobium lentis]MBX5177977.1 class I SAM-dependent methyltransferase [Rhizobium lentis]PDT28383.1 SAM-dependent methyltransferase [Rhizobium sp. L9]